MTQRKQTPAKAQAKAVAKPPSQQDIAVVLQGLALNPDVDVDKMERLMQMQISLADRMKQEQLEHLAREAEMSFNKAIALVSTQLQPVRTDAENDHTKSKYATLSAIGRAVDPILSTNGISMSFYPAESGQEGIFRTAMDVRHIDGHCVTRYLDLPHDLAGAQGRANKNAIQAVGSTFSYAHRYLKVNFLDLSVDSSDDDGQALTDPLLTPEQVDMVRGHILKRADEGAIEATVKHLAEIGGSHDGTLEGVRVSGLQAIRFALATVGKKEDANADTATGAA